MWAKHAVWALIENNVWAVAGRTEKERHHARLVCFRSELFRWYGKYREENPGKAPLTELSGLTPKMIGASEDRKLKTKGAETWGVGLFCIHALEKHAHAVGDTGARLLEAGKALIRMYTVCQEADPNLTPQQLQAI